MRVMRHDLRGQEKRTQFSSCPFPLAVCPWCMCMNIWACYQTLNPGDGALPCLALPCLALPPSPCLALSKHRRIILVRHTCMIQPRRSLPCVPSLQGRASPLALANLRSGSGDWTAWFAAGTCMPQGQGVAGQGWLGRSAGMMGGVWCGF